MPELLVAAVPVLAIGILTLREMPVFWILGTLLVARVWVDGPNNFTLSGMTATAVAGILILALALASGIRGWRAFVPYLVFCAALFVSSLQALEIDQGAGDEFLRWASVLGVWVIIANLRRRPRAVEVLGLIQIVGAVSVIPSLYQLITGTGLLVAGVQRATGTMAHPNSAALLYGMAALASLIAYFSYGRRRGNLWLVLLFLAGLLSSGSMGGIATFAIMLGAYAVISPGVPRGVRRWVGTIGLAGVIAFVWTPLGAGRIAELSGLDLSGASGERNSLEWRFGRWRDLLEHWTDSPLIGAGYGSTVNGALLNGYAPHSEYVRVLVEMGVVGAVLAAIVVIALIRRCLGVARSQADDAPIAGLALAAIVGFLTNALAENTFMYSVPGYLLVALLAFSATSPTSIRRVNGTEVDANRWLSLQERTK